MQRLRAMGPKFRIVVAVLFGFMSLIHGPVMASAKAGAQPGAQAAVLSASSHHFADGEHHSASQPGHQHQGAAHGNPHHGAALCYNSGDCFIAVTPPSLTPPTVFASLMQKLTPATAPQMVAAEIPPSDPPPRIQV